MSKPAPFIPAPADDADAEPPRAGRFERLNARYAFDHGRPGSPLVRVADLPADAFGATAPPPPPQAKPKPAAAAALGTSINDVRETQRAVPMSGGVILALLAGERRVA